MMILAQLLARRMAGILAMDVISLMHTRWKYGKILILSHLNLNSNGWDVMLDCHSEKNFFFFCSSSATSVIDKL